MREKLSTKKSLVIVVVAGLVIITALLIYSILVAPARQPYRDALTQYTNVNTALSQTNIALNASTASGEEFDEGIAAAQAALVALEKENEALAKEAVLTEGEGKPLFETYSKDLQTYIAYNAAVLESMKKVRPVFHACSDTMSVAVIDEEAAKVMRTCAVNMQNATDVPDADYKQLAEDFQAVYTELAIVFERIVATTDTNSAEYKDLIEQRTEAVEKFSEASDTFAKNVQQHRKEILSTKSANELKTYLEDKSRVF